MALDFVATADGTKLPTLTRTDGANSVEVPESVASFDNGSQVPQRVTSTTPLPVRLYGDAAVTGTLSALNAAVSWGGGGGFVGVEVVITSPGTTISYIIEVSPRRFDLDADEFRDAKRPD